MRILIALAVLGVASAQSASIVSVGDAIYQRAMHLWRNALTTFPFLDENTENAPQRERPMQKWREEMKKAHQCHERCGYDADCHKKCPKPWMPIVKACQDWPKIKACHDACKDKDCAAKCPKFEKEWMNKKYARNPEKATHFAEEKCPEVEKAHACHEACKPGDMECHHACPSMFHDHHGDPWHRPGGRNAHMHRFRKRMQIARECHKKCGSDADCHKKCPKPWKPIVKACQDFPKIKACHDKCKDADCAQCPKFDEDWMNKKYEQFPKRAEMFAEKKCPLIEKAHACHKACPHGDFECHRKCPRPFVATMKGHHHRSHGVRKDILV